METSSKPGEVPAGSKRPDNAQDIGLSKLETKEKRAFRYLDFADNGTNAALNIWGQFLQFSRLVAGGGGPDSCEYISVEPRNILRIEHIVPPEEEYFHENEQEEDSKPTGVFPDWEPDNPDWKPSVSHYSEYRAYPRRHDRFSALCMQNQGLGLRFSDNTTFTDPEHYYRNDRWPEVRYTVEGKVNVVLQHYIRDGKIFQDMTLTSESDEETSLNLEFEFTTGIRMAPGGVKRMGEEEKEKELFDHILQRVPEAMGSQWKISRKDHYATASLFQDGKPKSFCLLGDSEHEEVTKCELLSNEPRRHAETFVLAPKAKTKFTSIFELGHVRVPNAPPKYTDIAPDIALFRDRWWNFRTESSSFIFRRNLETILAHAMPLPVIEGEEYRPYVLHDHDLVNTFQVWSSSINQALYLLEMEKILRREDTAFADPLTKEYYRKRIREVVLGYFIWLLKYVERNGFSESVLLHWSGKPMEGPTEDEPVKGEPNGGGEKEEVPSRSPKESPEVEEPMKFARSSMAEVDSVATGADSPLADPTPVRPVEPELSMYEDKFRNCCLFIGLLDACLSNYPNETSLLTRMVKAFLQSSWEPIEMSKHQWSHLWPDQLDNVAEPPPLYARFVDWSDPEYGGYGGQDVYVYNITTQVLVWRTVRSTNRLLSLVSKEKYWSKWVTHQSLDDKVIRDRTIEAFRQRTTEMGHDSFPDRFVSIIKAHIRESLLDQWNCDIVVPSFVEDFFYDDKGEPMFAWTETLRYHDFLCEAAKARVANTWESFLRYQLAIDKDRRRTLRESFESLAYGVGLFTNETVTEDYTELPRPEYTIPMHIDNTRTDASHGSHADRLKGPMPQQEGPMGTGITPMAGAGMDIRRGGREQGKVGKGLDITAEDRSQVNDPPSYGEWYWFREPVFMKHKPKEFEINKESVEAFLDSGYWDDQLWETVQGKENFLNNMGDISQLSDCCYLILPARDGADQFQGAEVWPKLKGQRDRKRDKKWLLFVPALTTDCVTENLIAIMATLDHQEAGHMGEFFSRLRIMDSHEMRFSEKTIMPDNLWITEFNINFIVAARLGEPSWTFPPNYFPKKHAKFQSLGQAQESQIMVEAAMGFRIIGDLHDKYWTCYVFYDFGGENFPRGGGFAEPYNHVSHQRKCIEGFLVIQALNMVLDETKKILQIITKSMGPSNEKSQALFTPLITEDDLSGENYFKTMNKNSVFYPWLLEVYSTLHDKCAKSRNVAEQWLAAEKTRKYKPRWSEKDQKCFGKEVARNRQDVKARCNKLESMAKNLQERIDRIKTLKESLSSELGLREARTSTQLAHTVNLFAVVTTIYLPLTFSTSIVAIQDFKWPDPAKALIRITLAVTFGTIILLMNLAFLRRNIAALQSWAQRSIRQGMGDVPETSQYREYTTVTTPPKGASKEKIYPEARPAWEYWRERARGLREAEKRNTLLTDNAIHDDESDWWYWYFMLIFVIIVVPVQELTFIIRTLRGQKIKDAGPLKKLVRLPFAPIWIVQLVLVYAVILVGYLLLLIASLLHRTAVWLWTSNDIAAIRKAAAAREEKAHDETDSGGGGGGGGNVEWWRKPAQTMQFYIVSEALWSGKMNNTSDPEKGGL